MGLGGGRFWARRGPVCCFAGRGAARERILEKVRFGAEFFVNRTETTRGVFSSISGGWRIRG